jgi:hypothetical protein
MPLIQVGSITESGDTLSTLATVPHNFSKLCHDHGSFHLNYCTMSNLPRVLLQVPGFMICSLRSLALQSVNAKGYIIANFSAWPAS